MDHYHALNKGIGRGDHVKICNTPEENARFHNEDGRIPRWVEEDGLKTRIERPRSYGDSPFGDHMGYGSGFGYYRGACAKVGP